MRVKGIITDLVGNKITVDGDVCSFSCYLSNFSPFSSSSISLESFPWCCTQQLAAFALLCCHLGYFSFFFSPQQLLSQSSPPRWPLLLRLYHFSSVLIQPAGCSFCSPVSTDRPEMDAHWSFVARKKESPANVFPSFTVFFSPHFFFLNAFLSFQAGRDLWPQPAVEEEETVGLERKRMMGESQTDMGSISG